MKILIDIGHPAHVHLFKNLAHNLEKDGNPVQFTVREKEYEIELLKNEKFNYTCLGRHYKSRAGKIFGIFKFSLIVLKISLKFRPDIFLSHGSIYTGIASFILHKPNIALEDTGNWEQVYLYLPFTKVILTSNAFLKSYGGKQIRYAGYHELAYLHPKYFSPDNNILNKLGLSNNEKYVLIRLVSWSASHDSGQSGLSEDVLITIIKILSSSFFKIFISSEKPLSPELEKFKFSLSPHEMHDAIALADLYIGEGATMASECAMLGTPAIYVNSINADSINEQEKLGLLFHINNPEAIIKKVKDLILNQNIKIETMHLRNEMLKEKIDVTKFFTWFIENYPQSAQIMKENFDYQYNFK